MNKIIQLFLAVLVSALCLCASAAVSRARESIAKMYQDGLFKETSLGDLEGAIEVYRNILVKHSSDREFAARAQLRMGLCYEVLGKKEDAVRAFQAVVARFPDQATMVAEANAKLAALGPVYAEKGDQDSQELLEAYYLGEFAFFNGDYDLCINSMKKVLALQPRDRDTAIWARDFLARAYEALGQKEKAAEERRRIWQMAEDIKLPSKSFAEAYDLARLYRDDPYLKKGFVGPSLMGMAAFKRGSYDDAIKYLNKALEVEDQIALPLLNKTYVVLGWAYEKKGMRDEARKRYGKVLSRFEKEGPGLYEELDPYYFLAKEPKFPNSDAWHYYKRGDQFVAAKRYDEAVAALEKAISEADSFPWMKVYMTYLSGLACFKAGKSERADEYLSSARKLAAGLGESDPAFLAAVDEGLVDMHYSDIAAAELCRQGNFDRKIGHYASAIKNFSKALSYAKSPGMEARVRLSLAELYTSQGKEKEARKEYARILELDTMVAGPQRKHLRAAVDRACEPELYESKAWNLFQKGQTSFNAEDYGKAIEHFEKAIKTKPQWPWLDAWLYVWLGTSYMEKWWEEERKLGPPAFRVEDPHQPREHEQGPSELDIDKGMMAFQYGLEYAETVPEPHSEKLREAVKAAREGGMFLTREYAFLREAERILMEGGNPEAAAQLLEKAEPGPPFLGPRIQLDRALAVAARGNMMEAGELMENVSNFYHEDEEFRQSPLVQSAIAQARYPDFCFSELGRTYRKAVTDYEDGNDAAAIGGLEAVLESKEEIPLVRAQANIMLGRIQERRGEVEEAKKSYARGMALKEKDQPEEPMELAKKEAAQRLAALKRPPGEREQPVDDGETISWKEARKYIGQVKKVRGRVYNAFREDDDRIVRLELWPNPEQYPPWDHPTAVIYKPDLDKFPERPEDHYREKNVVVSGMIDRLGGMLRMRLRSPSQIEIAEDQAGEEIEEAPPPGMRGMMITGKVYAFDKEPSESSFVEGGGGSVIWHYSVPEVRDDTWAALAIDINPMPMWDRRVLIKLDSKNGHPIHVRFFSYIPGYSKEDDDETFVPAEASVSLKKGHQEIVLDPSTLPVPEWWRIQKKAPRLKFNPDDVRAIEFDARVEKELGPVSDTVTINAVILR